MRIYSRLQLRSSLEKTYIGQHKTRNWVQYRKRHHTQIEQDQWQKNEIHCEFMRMLSELKTFWGHFAQIFAICLTSTVVNYLPNRNFHLWAVESPANGEEYHYYLQVAGPRVFFPSVFWVLGLLLDLGFMFAVDHSWPFLPNLILHFFSHRCR